MALTLLNARPGDPVGPPVQLISRDEELTGNHADPRGVGVHERLCAHSQSCLPRSGDLGPSSLHGNHSGSLSVCVLESVVYTVTTVVVSLSVF